MDLDPWFEGLISATQQERKTIFANPENQTLKKQVKQIHKSPQFFKKPNVSKKKT